MMPASEHDIETMYKWMMKLSNQTSEEEIRRALQSPPIDQFYERRIEAEYMGYGINYFPQQITFDKVYDVHQFMIDLWHL